MKDISGFEGLERVFFAGCIKNMIMADRQFDESELNELDKLLEDCNFTDYEESLEEFESTVRDSDTFWEMAENIENPETQEIILEILYDLSIQKGMEDPSEEHLITQLKEIWQL
jgi:hypothetical protein